MSEVDPIITSLGSPTMSRLGFVQVLQAAQSPAYPIASEMWDACATYYEGPVDPAYVLAVFCHESTYGKNGVAYWAHNVGNLRWGPRCDEVRSGFAVYHGLEGWVKSTLDVCRLLHKYARGEIVGDPCKYRHPDHVHALYIAMHWAPAEDGNVPASYAAHVERLVRIYREDWPMEPPGPSIEERLGAIEAEIAAWRSECSGMNGCRSQIGELIARMEALGGG